MMLSEGYRRHLREKVTQHFDEYLARLEEAHAPDDFIRGVIYAQMKLEFDLGLTREDDCFLKDQADTATILESTGGKN